MRKRIDLKKLIVLFIVTDALRLSPCDIHTKYRYHRLFQPARYETMRLILLLGVSNTQRRGALRASLGDLGCLQSFRVSDGQ